MKVEAPFIHLIKLHTKYYLYDVNSKMIVNISNDLFDFFKSNENIKAEIEIPHKLEDEVRRLLKYDLFSKTDTGYEIEYPQGTNLEEILNNCMRIMTLQVTQNCNLRCKYCVYSGSYSNRVHSNKRMSFETAKSAIDFLYAHSSMTTSIGIGFYGGEPLLEFDLLKKCVEYAKMKFIGKDLSFTLTTNATLLTEEIMKFFVKNNFFVTISFDGPQVIQDKNRVMADGKSGSFETVMKNVEMFLNKYPDFSWHVSFNAVLDPTNDFSCSNDFFMNFETVKSITANGVLVSTDGLKKELEKDETFSIAYEYEMFKNFLCSCGKLDKIGSKLSVAYIEQLEKLVAKREVGIEKNKKFAHPGGPCLIGVHKFFVNADGNFYPCERVDESANVNMAAEIIFNAKTQRIGVCNACESLVIHENIIEKALPAIKAKLDEKNVIIRGDKKARAVCPDIEKASEEDFGTEYLDYIISVKTVSSLDEAIEHINKYSTGHSEAIITENKDNADKFMKLIDSSSVYHNASTRFTDGGEFGLGAEIGISTQKLHARGPMGLRELTTTKYLIFGDGQIR